MKKILFVCTGNVCRSPMAEGLLRYYAKEQSIDLITQSAGLGAVQGQCPSAHAITVMNELGIDISNQCSQPVTAELISWADLILVMTYSHLDLMLMLFPKSAEKTFIITEFQRNNLSTREILDPFGMSLDAYLQTRNQIQLIMPDLIHFLKTSKTAQTSSSNPQLHPIALGADHGGVELKDKIRHWLQEQGYPVTDFGASSFESVDYPDYAHEVALAVATQQSDYGILVCKSGIGMSIAANRIRGVRAALVHNVEAAKLSREHNDANVLCLSSNEVSSALANEIIKNWLSTPFAGGRHERRLQKVESLSSNTENSDTSALASTDLEVFNAIRAEEMRQSENIELIASENFTSRAVMEAQGSCLTNKYAEGYPKKRWYGGCEYVDIVEQLAIDRAKKLFQADHVNVQPHSGSQANMAVYMAVLKPGDKILTMNLAHGGHLTHGHPLNFSGRLYQVTHYGVSAETETIDYNTLAQLAEQTRPRMITAGASAYSRIIDFKRLRQIADSVNAYLFIDMAHIAGLVAAGVHPSPVPYADFVTSTTHKTLRGPRGGIILCREQHAKEIDSLLFPGTQGGPLMHVIAGKAVCFLEALQPGFIEYQRQVVRNAKALCDGMKSNGYRIVSGTTENHVMLIDLQPKNLTGKEAQEALDRAGITVNKNAIPFDKQSPFKAGGIRLGSPAVTTRGFKEKEMQQVADLIHQVLSNKENAQIAETVHDQVRELTSRFPLPS